MAFFWLVLLVLGPLGLVPPPELKGVLTDNQRIESTALGYTLQYRVYLPPGYADLADLPVLYLTDGQWYIQDGQVPEVLDALILDKKIAPVVAVFVDNRNPDRLSENRRNRQFFCNQDYARFFKAELIPAIDAQYATAADRTQRVILGLSFGALNSACFGLFAHEAFEGIAMQSPSTHPVPSLHAAYSAETRLPLNIFLSSGSVQDNEAQTRRFKAILEAKGYPMKYIEVPHGHSWANWQPLIDDVLLYFFGLE